ncbi:MAG: hypothetical protein KW793_01345 [Candidatus Doudnabacteria bacterium]|nr:hypothetical protein [Candidatus Doudnabacteria bacterium]
MKLHLNKSQISLRLILVGVFVAVLLAAAYLTYSYLYASVFSTDVPLPEGNVVRVNLKAYQSTIEYLEGLNRYQPEPMVLPRNNPFQ